VGIGANLPSGFAVYPPAGRGFVSSRFTAQYPLPPPVNGPAPAGPVPSNPGIMKPPHMKMISIIIIARKKQKVKWGRD
jgi:hypothetical protein